MPGGSDIFEGKKKIPSSLALMQRWKQAMIILILFTTNMSDDTVPIFVQFDFAK